MAPGISLPAAAAREQVVLGGEPAGEVGQVDDLALEAQRPQGLGDVDDPAGLVGELGRVRRHHLAHHHPQRVGVDHEVDVLVAALHHHRAGAGDLGGHRDQRGRDRRVDVRAVHEHALVGAREQLDRRDRG